MNQARAFRGISTLNIVEAPPKLKKNKQKNNQTLNIMIHKVSIVLAVPKWFETQNRHGMCGIVTVKGCFLGCRGIHQDWSVWHIWRTSPYTPVGSSPATRTESSWEGGQLQQAPQASQSACRGEQVSIQEKSSLHQHSGHYMEQDEQHCALSTQGLREFCFLHSKREKNPVFLFFSYHKFSD